MTSSISVKIIDSQKSCSLWILLLLLSARSSQSQAGTTPGEVIPTATSSTVSGQVDGQEDILPGESVQQQTPATPPGSPTPEQNLIQSTDSLGETGSEQGEKLSDVGDADPKSVLLSLEETDTGDSSRLCHPSDEADIKPKTLTEPSCEKGSGDLPVIAESNRPGLEFETPKKEVKSVKAISYKKNLIVRQKLVLSMKTGNGNKVLLSNEILLFISSIF